MQMRMRNQITLEWSKDGGEAQRAWKALYYWAAKAERAAKMGVGNTEEFALSTLKAEVMKDGIG